MSSPLFRTLTAMAAGVAAVSTATVHAQPAEVEIATDKDWEHAWTEMRFPASIGEFERSGVTAFEERETNIAGSYYHAGTDTILTLYIYRPGNASTAIWFDRALIAIGAPDAYGAVDLEDMKIASFIPSGGSKASGLSAVLAVDGNFRSTGVAMYRSGEWLVKVRVSSRRLSVAQMDSVLKSTLGRMPALDNVDPNPAQFVAECDAVPTSSATVVTDNLGTIALGEAIALVAMQLPEEDRETLEETGSREVDPATLTYCREGPRSRQYNVFRSTDGNDRFTVALGDAGRSVDVYPDAVATELDTTSAMTTYAVRSATGLEYVLHTPYVGLPSVQQVGQSLSGQVIATVTRPLEDGVGADISLSVAPE